MLVVLIGTAVVAHDGHMLRAEAESLSAGRIDEAGARARRVVLLREAMRAQLLDQLPALEVGDRRFPRELPLVEALLALAPDAELARRRQALRVLAEDRPEVLTLVSREVTLGERVAPPTGQLEDAVDERARWRAAPFGALGADGERAYRLSCVTLAGRDVPVGTGWSGLLGRSWDVSRDATAAAVARADERLLERWTLATGRVRPVTVPHPPRSVALPPTGDDGRLIWGAGRQPGAAHAQVLYVQEGGQTRRIFPPAGVTPAAVGCEWDPDGQTLLVRWTDRWPHRPGDRQHLTWLTLDGRPLLRAWTPLGPHTPPVRWVRGPGSWIGLDAGEVAWAWDGRAPEARLLQGVRGAWGWSPGGRLVAGVDVGHLFVASAAAPHRRREFKLERLPPLFVPDAEGLAWDANGLRIAGRAAERAQGPWRKARVVVVLAVAP